VKDLLTQNYLTGDYLEYQARYRQKMRKSDEALLAMIKDMLARYFPGRSGVRLADIGCSTGNFLLHLRHAELGLTLFGRDAYPEVIDNCQATPELAGIDFGLWDVREASPERFDILVLNAMLGYFKADELANVLANLGASLVPGGLFLAFAWLNPFEQEIYITERSPSHPDGAVLNIHSYALFSRLMNANGFEPPQFTPFEIPIDLPRPTAPDDPRTYTETTLDGRRLNFRGSIFQPWCHVAARKKA